MTSSGTGDMLDFALGSPKKVVSAGGVPWPQIVGMRHHLVHEYTKIDLDAVWKAATESVPDLIVALESILPAEPS